MRPRRKRSCWLGGRRRSPFLSLVLLLLWSAAGAWSAASASAQATRNVILLSDLHFDALRDPGKAGRLAAAPVAGWNGILNGPDSPGQAEGFAAMQQGCGARGVDSDARLLARSLHESALHAAGAGFVLVSGDLLVHTFKCRYKLAFKDEEGFASFAEKTANYVMGEVERAFPGVPVYFSLGNNDSACGDYRLDGHDRFFKATSSLILKGMAKAGASEKVQARRDYEAEGNYSAVLPGMRKTRLLVVNDTYFSRLYKTCEGVTNAEGPAAVAAWLARELEAARIKGERVWVMGHIPPGVDVYNTVVHMRDVCGVQGPELLLGDDRLSELLARYADVVKLAIFGHTHMDELRVIPAATEDGLGVPVKLVASVSPVDGNAPSFTVGVADSGTGSLRDYVVYVANDKTGEGSWKRDYGFGETYGRSGFTYPAVSGLVERFRKDRTGGELLSKAYIKEFFKGGGSPLLLVWPEAVCAMQEPTASGYKSCWCGTGAK